MWRVLSICLLLTPCVLATEASNTQLLKAVQHNQIHIALTAFKQWATALDSLDASEQQRELVALDKQLQDYDSSLAIGLRSRLYLKANRLAEAKTLITQAILAAKPSYKEQALLIRWHWDAGRISAQQQGEMALAAAIRSYELAIQQLLPKGIVFQWQALSCDSETLLMPYQELRTLFLELADLLLQRAAKPDVTQADKQADLRQIIATLEQLKLADIQRYFGDCGFFSRDDITVRWTQQPNTAVIYPVLSEQNPSILLMIAGQSDILAFSMSETREQIDKLVQAVRKDLSDKALSKQLYQALITPLLPALNASQIETLLFVPEGSLSSIPWSALLNDSDRYLIQDYAISILPALSLLKPNHAPPVQQWLVLAGGLTEDADIGSASIQELNLVQKFFPPPDTIILQNQAFNSDRLQQSLNDYTVNKLHISTHAFFDKTAKKSKIQLFNDELDASEFIDMLIKPEVQPLQFIILSACSTAEGDDGWAALGLAGMTVKAKVPNLLATLWEVDPGIMHELLTIFYEEYLASGISSLPLSKAKALQAAQLHFIKKEPEDWASVVLIGEP